MTADRHDPLSAKRFVLVVEPDVLVRVVVAEYLREAGLMVVEAIDAVEALAVHRSDFAIDVTLVNVAGIGDTPSFELARRIRAKTPRAHVLLVSTVESLAREVQHLCSSARAGSASSPVSSSHVSSSHVRSSHGAALLEQRLRRLLKR